MPTFRPSRRRWTGYDGLFFDEFAPDSAWIRELAVVRLPKMPEATSFVIRGEFRPHPDAHGLETGPTGAVFFLNRSRVASLDSVQPGPFSVRFTIASRKASRGATLRVGLRGVGFTNFLAWLGRVAARWPVAARLQRFRRQNKNRQLRITRIETAAGELVFDFSIRHSPFSPEFARQRVRTGLNIAGFLTADLGIGESARCMVRAADATLLPAALIDLKLRCKNQRSDLTYLARLQEESPHPVSVIHLDPPASRDIDARHPTLRRGKYNIAYWAWELPEFPDSWIPCCDYFDEIWCPSEFARTAIAMKVPLPVHTMPHAISFPRPAESSGVLRARFGLPTDKFLFLLLYDLNSYSMRKNPGAVIEAFRASGLAGRGAALVIKTHSTAGNEAELAALRAAVASLPGTTLITDTFLRTDIYALEAACDCLVSLHRSEGFGLVVAECMFLGKPVIATDWSATAEFLNETNGCPVRACPATLGQNHGPYAKGQTWAEPDVAHAAWWMQKLAGDAALCTRLGDAARATIEQKFSPARIGARYRQRLETIACW
ncbi:MAG TPA: glycosyltransferase [Opitutaceae bacterium]|jgi:glycosyltransferase involved in cell wall biosynthesis|nr:glycosyltransferase [Opitutaceae bacterium]